MSHFRGRYVSSTCVQLQVCMCSSVFILHYYYIILLWWRSVACVSAAELCLTAGKLQWNHSSVFATVPATFPWIRCSWPTKHIPSVQERSDRQCFYYVCGPHRSAQQDEEDWNISGILKMSKVIDLIMQPFELHKMKTLHFHGLRQQPSFRFICFFDTQSHSSVR